MCGVPASGKSTIAKNLSARLNNIPIVSMDDIREELFGTRKCQKEGYLVYKLAVNKIIRLFNDSDIVIFDATNRFAKARKQVIQDIQDCVDCGVYCVFVNTPLDVALDRNTNRNESIQVPPIVIRRMYETLQPPTYEEYFYEKIFEIIPETLDTCGDAWYNVFANQMKGDLEK